MVRGLPALVFLLFLFPVKVLYAQQGTNEQQALDYARSLYALKIGQQAGIYQGREYIGYPHPTKEGNPYFFSDSPDKGSIRYDGMLYHNIPLWYDISKNEIVVLHYNNVARLTLQNDKVDHFTLYDHHFIRIDSAFARQNNLKAGFYDQIYTGTSEVLARRSKDMVIITDQAGIWVSFSKQKNDLFLRKDQTYYPISNQKSVLAALGKYKQEILTQLKQSKLKYRRNREQAIILMVSFYDQLNKQG